MFRRIQTHQLMQRRQIVSKQKNSQPSVLLTGTYSSYNKGDAAMQLSMAQSVRKMWPNADITISAPFPEFDKDFYQEYRVVKSTRRNLILGTIHLILAKLYKLTGWSLFIGKSEELRIFADSDIIIDLSGDTLTEDYGPHVTYSHFLPILLGLAFGKPVFVCAQSIGPFKLTTEFAKYVLNKTSAITAREEITYNYLKKLGVKKSILSRTADMAFLLEPVSEKRARSILKDEGIKFNSDRKILGVTVSELVEKRYNANSPKRADDFVSDMAKMLDKLIQHNNVEVIFIGHVTGPSEIKDDRLIAQRVKSAMDHGSSKFAHVLFGNYRPDELKGIISLCDAMLGSRMHSNIGALSTHTPTIAIGYSHKTEGIMSSLGLQDYTFSIDTLDTSELSKAVNRALRDSTQIKKLLEKGIRDIKAESDENLAIVETLLERRS